MYFCLYLKFFFFGFCFKSEQQHAAKETSTDSNSLNSSSTYRSINSKTKLEPIDSSPLTTPSPNPIRVPNPRLYRSKNFVSVDDQLHRSHQSQVRISGGGGDVSGGGGNGGGVVKDKNGASNYHHRPGQINFI